MEGQYNLRNPAVKRLMKEAQELREPTEQYYAHPIEDNLFEWHFTIRGPDESEFGGGVYHGRIILPPEYPMKPPSIMMLTSNGRFETNKKICLSISGYHPESWQPSWSIRTALLAIIGFMPSHGNGAIGSLDYTTEERKKLAKRSQDYKCQHCGCVRDTLKPVTEASKATSQEARELASQISFQAEKEKGEKTEDEGDKGTTSSSASSTPSQETTSSSQSATTIPPNPFAQMPQFPGFPPGQPLPGGLPGSPSMFPPMFPFGMMRPPNSTQAPMFWPPQFPPMPSTTNGAQGANRGVIPPMPMWPGFNPMMMQRMMGAGSFATPGGLNLNQTSSSTQPCSVAVSTPGSTTSSAPASSALSSSQAQKSATQSSQSRSSPTERHPSTPSSSSSEAAGSATTTSMTAKTGSTIPAVSTSSGQPAPSASTTTTSSQASSSSSSTNVTSTAATTAQPSQPSGTSSDGLRQRNVGQQPAQPQAQFAAVNQPAELSYRRNRGENSFVVFIMFLLAFGIAVLLMRRLYTFLPKITEYE